MVEVVDLGQPASLHLTPDECSARRREGLLIGLSRTPLTPRTAAIAEHLDLTLAPGGPGMAWIANQDGDVVDTLASTADRCTAATGVLRTLLDVAPRVSTYEGLHLESHAYSMLLGGPDFRAWRASNAPRPPTADPADPVLLDRDGDTLRLTLNRPHRRNAYSRSTRDRLVEGLQLAQADRSISRVELRGNGPDFCSGGDLDEFGTAPDPVAAHHARTARSAGLLIDEMKDRVHAHLHGSCIGAGIELPAFAGTVHADRSTTISLPELAMGLVPGAGGTVSLPARVGRHRTLFLALSGRPIDGATAHAWGLVDQLH